MKFLLDTHIWLWSLLTPEKLAPHIADSLKQTQHELFLSPITVWETLILVEKGRISLDLPPQKWVWQALHKSPVQELPLTHEIALKSRAIELYHEDPAARFIAATAWAYNFILVTEDRFLKRASQITVLSSDIPLIPDVET